MTFDELVRANRSFRRFDESAAVSPKTLLDLVDLARQCPSAGNLQPLRYIPCTDRGVNAAVFDCLTWAAYLKEWSGPVPGERPSAYIVVLADASAGKFIQVDLGIAAQTILLAARSRGLGGCMLAAINRPRLREVFGIAEHFEIPLVIALGVPVETVVLTETGPEGDIRYWRDDDGTHYVPKRHLDDVIVSRRH